MSCLQLVNERDSSSLRECCGDSLFQDLKNLVGEVTSYRSQLQGEKLEQFTGRSVSPFSSSHHSHLFTDSWGWSLLMESSQQSPHRKKDVFVVGASKLPSHLASRDETHSTVQQNLAKELAVVRKDVFKEYRWLKEGDVSTEACLEAKRLRMLYLFVKDLSSGVSGEVLSKKAQRDGLTKRMGGVWWFWKFLGWLFVILMNLGMLLYVYLFAMRQTQSRQLARVQSFVTWLIFDLFIAGTGVVLVTHLLIPLYVMSDIRTIKKKVTGDIIAFQNQLKQRPQSPLLPLPRVREELVSVDERRDKRVQGCSNPNGNVNSGLENEEFNSAKYLFTSWRVAWLCQEIPESQLILQFSTPWPKQSLKSEKKKVTKTYERRYSFIGQALSRVLIFFLTSLIHLPLMLQDLLIHLLSNSGLGYLMLLILRLARIHPFLPVLALLMLGVVIHFLVKTSSSSDVVKSLSKVSVAQTETEIENKNDAAPAAAVGREGGEQLAASAIDKYQQEIANLESGMRNASPRESTLCQSPPLPSAPDQSEEEKVSFSSGGSSSFSDRSIEWEDDEDEEEAERDDKWELSSDDSTSSLP
jgi:hypothetical protein